MSRFQERRPALVSAITGDGIPELLDAIDARLGASDTILDITIPAHDGRLLAWVHENTDVLTRTTDEETGALRLTLRTTPENKARLEANLRKSADNR
jgi:GTP-binding protein HflX